MQIRYIKRRSKAVLYGSIAFLILSSTNLQAYPGCCYDAKIYHKEWEKVGKYMKKFYTDAAKSTRKANQELTNAIPYLLFRSTNIISSMAYIEIFDASDAVRKDIYKEYTALYMTSTGPKVFDKIIKGENPLDVMAHPPRIEKSLSDFVVRSHAGAKDKGILYGNQHLTKREIVYVKKEKQQICVNNDLEIKKLEADIQMLELALAKLSVLSNQVISDEKNKKGGN